MSEASVEVEPPWVHAPGYPPGDPFWRQSGEAWLTFVFRPYWDSLKSAEQVAYLERWHAPQDWQLYYFSPEFTNWLDSVDDE